MDTRRQNGQSAHNLESVLGSCSKANWRRISSLLGRFHNHLTSYCSPRRTITMMIMMIRPSLLLHFLLDDDSFLSAKGSLDDFQLSNLTKTVNAVIISTAGSSSQSSCRHCCIVLSPQVYVCIHMCRYILLHVHNILHSTSLLVNFKLQILYINLSRM